MSSQPIVITTLIDSFKHSFSSRDVSNAAQSIFSQHQSTTTSPFIINSFQISDGGEGFIDAMSTALNIAPITHNDIIGPLQQRIDMQYLYDANQQLVVMESAQGVGIQGILPHQLNPRVISSHGVGAQLRHILLSHHLDFYENQTNTTNCTTTGTGNTTDSINFDIEANGQQHQQTNMKQPNGVKTIILGLGGTASVDCGLGLLFGLLNISCYTMSCKEEESDPTSPSQHISRAKIPTKGAFDVCLGDIMDIFLPTPPNSESNHCESCSDQSETALNWKVLKALMSTQIILASDVTNPLLGPHGAVHVFGPQKGVKNNELVEFENGMRSFSTLLQQLTNSPVDLQQQPGCGAAGGIGYALYCLWHYYQHHLNNTSNHQNELNNQQVSSMKPILMQSGFELLYSFTTISTTMLQANPTRHIIITGEGKFDEQSLDGKVIDRVCNVISKIHRASGQSAAHSHIPVIVLCGKNDFLTSSPQLTHFNGSISINGGNVSEDMKQSTKLSEMNIIKIIDINDTKYHLTPNEQYQSELKKLPTDQQLQLKLKHGLDNVKLTFGFLQQMLSKHLDDETLLPFLHEINGL